MIAPPVSAPVSRRRLLGAATAVPIAALPAFALAGCADDPRSSTGGAVDEVTYLTSFGITPRECFVHVAEAMGFFAEANLAVSIQPGAAGDANHQALAGGAAQFAAVDSSGAFIRYARAADPATEGGDDGFGVVAAVHQLPLMALLAFADTGVGRPTDLEGSTIGLAAGSIAETLWPVYADLAGIDIDKVTTVPTTPQTQVQELVAGRLDAIAQFAVSHPSLQAAGGGRQVTVLAWSEVLTDLYGNVVVASRHILDTNPELVDRFVTALMRGLAYAIEHPQQAGDILHRAEPTQDPQVTATELTLMAPYVTPGAGDPVGVMHPDRMARAAALLQSTGALPAGAGLAYNQDVVAWPHIPTREGEAHR